MGLCCNIDMKGVRVYLFKRYLSCQVGPIYVAEDFESSSIPDLQEKL